MKLGRSLWGFMAAVALAMVLSSAASAQGIKYKAVYRDPAFHTNWNEQDLAQKVADYFVSQGYELLDEKKLRPWLDARIADRERSVLVNAHDTLPDSALDPVGSSKAPSANNPIRRYHLTGGRSINYGDIPFYLHATDINRAEAGWASGGGTVILGRPTIGGSWDLQAFSTLTPEGEAWGLTEEALVPSIRPNLKENVDIVLAEDENGQATSWIQKFTNVPGRGEFIRVMDRDLSVDDMTDELLAVLKALAEHDEPGQVNDPLDSGINGTLLNGPGQPVAAMNIRVKDASGKMVALSSTDDQGRFIAYLTPGTYTLELGSAVVDTVTGDVQVTVAANQIATANLRLALPNNGNFGDGLKAEYYEYDTSLGGSPDRLEVFLPENLKLTRYEGPVDWTAIPAPGVRGDKFAVRWTGTLVSPVTEDVTFYAAADDGIQLWVSETPIDIEDPGDPIIDLAAWRDQGDTEYAALEPMRLEQGKRYYILMEMYENGGGEAAHLRWSSASIPKGLISGTHLYSGTESVALGRVSGKLIDANQQPVSNGIVTITAGSRTYALRADADGNYIQIVPAGAAEIKGSFPDPWTNVVGTANANIAAGQDVVQNVVFDKAIVRKSLRAADLAADGQPGWAFLATTDFDVDIFIDMAPDYTAFINPNYNTTGEDANVPGAMWLQNWTKVPGDAQPVDRANVQPGEIPDNSYWVQVLRFTVPDTLQAAEGDLVLRGFNVDDQNEITALNGTKIGGESGVGQWDRNWSIPVAKNLVKFGGETNVLTIVGFEGGGGAGHNLDYGGPELVGLVPGSGAPPGVKGDANQNGTFEITDVIAVLRHVAGLTPLAGPGLAAADVNGNGVNITDAVTMLRAIAGLAPLP